MLRTGAVAVSGEGSPHAQTVTFPDKKGLVVVDRTQAGIARISFTERVFSLDALTELRGELSGLRADRAVRVVVLDIEARGADIKEFPAFLNGTRSAKLFVNVWHSLINDMLAFPKPLVAVVRNWALGGGYEIALACDYIIADKDAQVGLPELSLGILPGGGGTRTLAQRVGLIEALRMILGAKIVRAAHPFVDCVSDDPERSLKECLASRVTVKKMNRAPRHLSWMLRIKAWWTVLRMRSVWRGHEPMSFWLARDAVINGYGRVFDNLSDEWYVFSKAFETNDAKEGVAAFLAKPKRKPLFQGK